MESSYTFYVVSFIIGILVYMLSSVIQWFYRVWKSTQALKTFIHVKPHWLFGHLRIHPGPTEAGLLMNNEWVKMAPRLYTTHMGPFRPILNLNHPDTVKQMLKSHEPKNITGGGGYGLLLPWIGDGLLVSKGQKWSRNRRLLTPGFHFDILKPYMNVYNNCVEVFMGNVKKQSVNGQSVEIYNLVSLLTLEVILKCAFSYNEEVQLQGESSPYIKTVISLANLIVKRAMNPITYIDSIYYRTHNGREFRDHCEYSHNLANQVIQKRKANLETDEKSQNSSRYVDFLDILLLAKDSDGKGLSENEIRDEVETFMFEGHDTTASGISWALYNLARYPEYQRRVHEEIDAVIGDRNHTAILWEDLNKLDYLTMCIKESMRLNPPVFLISRELTQPTIIEGQLIPETTIMDINIWNVHHNPTVWGPDVMTYNPDRFLPENTKKMDSYAFIPFSAGPRNCIGQNFAMNEMKTSISRILHRFELSVDESHKVEMLPEIILKSKNGIKLFFKER